VDPEKHDIPRGDKIKVDTMLFFKTLLGSKVWVSNSGMDRGIDLMRQCNVRVETWHGAPIKKIGGEENQNSLGSNPSTYRGKLDADTIRCAQSEYDREIFARINHADKSAILLCDLPRNDGLLRYTTDASIKRKIGIDSCKKVILYAPTYREYLIDDHHDTYMAPPIHIEKWEKELGDEYVLLIRAHYAVTAALNIQESDFVKEVSAYPFINDLYIIADLLISDYSSSFIDFSILDRPMLCYAYDLEEYQEKRGLYIDLAKELPCEIDDDEVSLLNHIQSLDSHACSNKTKMFHKKYAPYAGNASKAVVDVVLKKL
jgi:CDP-glycerol glycerophosphotransferase